MRRRIAVSVLLAPASDSAQAYLVKRNPKLAFFGGYLAFPGGTLDPSDYQVPVENVVSEGVVPDPDLPAFIAAAARELFEETGLWLARGRQRPAPEDLKRYREDLLAETLDFAAILKKEDHHLDGRDFLPVCRIMTPPFTPVRYDTWFFRCILPEQSAPEIWPGELEEGFLISAESALEDWRQGRRLIAPPNIILLEELCSRDVESFLPAVRQLTASYARGKLHRVHFTPGVILAPLATRTRPPATHTNAYVIGESDFYLLDPGPTDRDQQQLLWELLDELIEEGRRFQGVLLTHYHPDHSGAVSECLRRYSVPLQTHRRSRLPYTGSAGYLTNGQKLNLGTAPDGSPGWQLEVLATPGHSPDHLAFRESRYGALFGGDLVSTLSSILIDPSEGDLIAYMQSLQSCRDRATGTLYPAHGPPVRQGRRAFEKMIAHRQQRERQLLEALARGPKTAEQLLPEVYSDTDQSLWNLARRSLESGLIKLIREERVQGDGEIFRRMA